MLDVFLYFVLLIAGIFTPLALYILAQRWIARSDLQTVFWANGGPGWNLFLLPEVLAFAYILCSWYPLPIRRGGAEIKAAWQKKKRGTLAALLLMLLFTLLSTPGLCRRSVMQEDLTLRKYDSFNHCVASARPEDAAVLRLGTVRERTRSGEKLYFSVYVRTADGAVYRFDPPIPTAEDVQAELQTLIDFRAAAEKHGARVVIESHDPFTPVSEMLPQIAEKQKYTEEQTKLLYELFHTETTG